MTNAHRIGVVSTDPLQRHVIQNVLSERGLDITIICDPVRLDDQPKERVEAVQCWILDLPEDDSECRVLDEIFESDALPVLYGLESAPDKNDEDYPRWERRLIGKLEAFLEDIEFDTPAFETPHHSDNSEANPGEEQTIFSRTDKPVRDDKTISDSVWILAASTGGPEAVKAFLDRIPVDIKTGFLYAQHIDDHFSGVLSKVLGRHGELPISMMQEGSALLEGEVMMVPVNHEVCFDHKGIHFLSNAWPGPYGPSINRLMENALAHYGQRCHAIIFSGMGDDGTAAAAKFKQAGCMVWTQSVESCANASMPQSVIDANCSDVSADPAVLADKLVRMVGTRLPESAGF